MPHNNSRILRKNEAKAIMLVAGILGAKKVVENSGVFDWLKGDTGMRLRVDAWFPDENLVLEYHGRQHFQANRLMDRRKGRAEQRKRYTLLRQTLIPKHGIKLLEIRYDEPLTEDYIREKMLLLGYKL